MPQCSVGMREAWSKAEIGQETGIWAELLCRHRATRGVCLSEAHLGINEALDGAASPMPPAGRIVLTKPKETRRVSQSVRAGFRFRHGCRCHLAHYPEIVDAGMQRSSLSRIEARLLAVTEIREAEKSTRLVRGLLLR